MVRVGREAIWFFLEGGANELKRSQTGECFEAFGEVVGIEEGVQVLSELSVMEVVVGADGGLLEGAVHAFDLAVGPRMAGLGQAVVDGVVSAGQLEGVRAEDFAASPGQGSGCRCR